MHQGTRDEMLGRLAEAVGSVTVTHPTRVAVDGPPAAGKTTLADELAVVLRGQGRDVIRATIDDFLFPRAQRYPRGEYSAEGCYYDTHDYHALNRVLLDPLGPGGDRRFQPAVYDHTRDAVLSPPVTTASVDAVLVFDGVFLLRPELIGRWDLRVFVSTALDRTVDRAVIRERRVASRADIERRWRERYIPSQQLYFATARPTEHADIVVHNDEPRQPAWESRAGWRQDGGRDRRTPSSAGHAGSGPGAPDVRQRGDRLHGGPGGHRAGQ
ncbi:uridine kinase [Micromonospora sp. AKA38]|nr:uridine kinase [Micromonospora sp. AKA38]